MIFSFSRLNLYEQCPYRFFNKYVLGKEEPVTEPLALGKAVHKAIESKRNLVSHDEAVLEGYMEAGCHPDIRYDDISQLATAAPVHFSGETEKYFKLPLEEDGPVLQGYIDVVQPDGSIIDWKTNRVPYGATETKQLALYCWAVNQLKTASCSSAVQGTYFFLRFRKEESFLFTSQDMEESRIWALNTANEIEEKLELYSMFPDKYKELFPANPSRLCSHCPFAIECTRDFTPIF